MYANTIILHDPERDEYLVPDRATEQEAFRAVELLSRTVGAGVYKYTGLVEEDGGWGTQRFHKFVFDIDAYAWLIGAKP